MLKPITRNKRGNVKMLFLDDSRQLIDETHQVICIGFPNDSVFCKLSAVRTSVVPGQLMGSGSRRIPEGNPRGFDYYLHSRVINCGC